MPPKPAPKLTKKQLQELQKEQARKKQQQQLQRKRIQEQKNAQLNRLRLIQQEKQRQLQRIRIFQQKDKYWPAIHTKMVQENKAYSKLIQEEQWKNYTSEYFKSYDTKQPKLSTFINIFKQLPFISQQKTLEECQQSQIYVQKLHQRLLSCRTQYDQKGEHQCSVAIKQLHQIQMDKLNDIMIVLANSAQEMEEKNNEFLKSKNQSNRKIDGQKLLQYKHFMSKNFKIGMFLNSSTTKNQTKFRPIQIKQFGLNTEVPLKLINANTIVKFEWINFNPYSIDNYQNFIIVGGIYNLQFYQLLLGSKKVSNFIVKKYLKGRQILDKYKSPSAVVKEPFQVMYQIPKYVFLAPMNKHLLKIAQYDFSTSKWYMLPNDTVIEYQIPQKKIVCRISKPQPIAYVIERCTDYPYVSWELRTVEKGVVHLDIQLKRFFAVQQNEAENKKRLMVKFIIQPNTVRLTMDQDYPELKDLCQNTRTPESILHQLSSRGIHLLPVDKDYPSAKIPQKNRQSQKNAIRDIAYAVESFYIRSQPNNTNDIIVKIRQNLDYESVFLEDQEKDWKKIKWADEDRCSVINRNIHQRHLNLQILLEEHQFTEPQCLDRIRYDRDFLLRKTVMKMLELTRLLSFTTAEKQESFLVEKLKQKVIIK